MRNRNIQINSAYVLRGERKISVGRCMEYVGCRISTTNVIKDQTIYFRSHWIGLNVANTVLNVQNEQELEEEKE